MSDISEQIPRLFTSPAQVSPAIQSPDTTDAHIEALLRVSEPQARGFLDRTRAFELQALPLQIIFIRNQRVIRIAVAEGDSPGLCQALSFATGLPVEIVKTDRLILREALSRAYLGDDNRFVAIAKDLHQFGEARAREQVVSHPAATASNEVTRFIDCLLDYAIAHRATDIHLTAGRDGTFVQLRVGGALRDHQAPLADLATHQQLISRIKVLSRLDITLRTIPQDGQFTHRHGERDIDIRVSTMPTVNGENVVLRVFGLENARPLEELGFRVGTLETILMTMRRCSGAVVLAGATGSGKTSTLYSMVRELQRCNYAISTIEDPVEITIDRIAQTGINQAGGFGFTQALRAALRQDPDVILLGEMRDSEGAESAFDAALSGHFILSTVHAGGVIDALMRLLGLGVQRNVIAQGLTLMVAQKLLRRLCPECRVFDLRSANVTGWDVYRAVGCPGCEHSGYKGRVLVAESLSINEAVRSWLMKGEILSRSSLIEVAGENFREFSEHLRELLERGEIGYGDYMEEC